MNLDDLAAHLAQRKERQYSEAQERMARYRAYLDRVDELFAQVRTWLQPLCGQGLLSFRHSIIRRDCVIRPEPIVGLEVVLGPFSLVFAPLSPDQASVENLSPLVARPNPVLGITLRPTHRSPQALPPSLTLLPDDGGDWRVSQGLSVQQSQPFDERFLASFLTQSLAAVDGASFPSRSRVRP